MNNIFSNDDTNGYDIKRNFWAFTAETGRLFNMSAPEFINNGQSLVSIEPKVELRYVQGESEDFTTDAGTEGFVDTTHSLVTRFNVQTSYVPNWEKPENKLFVELGVYNEWSGKTKTRFADADLTTSDLNSIGVEASLGFNAGISEGAYWYGAMTFETGKAYTSYLLNFGLRVEL